MGTLVPIRNESRGEPVAKRQRDDAPERPKNANEEATAIRLKAAKGLLALIGPHMSAPGEGKSRISSEEVDPGSFKLGQLIEQGGLKGAKNDLFRLFLHDWGAYGDYIHADLRTKMFPIIAVDAKACLNWLLAEEKPTAAGRVGEALSYAKALGMDVELNAPVLSTKKTRKDASASAGKNARDVPPPLAFVRIAQVANDEGEHKPPLVAYARCIQFDVMFNARGTDAHGTRVIRPRANDPGRPEDVIHTINECDKNGRENVEQFCPAVQFLPAGPDSGITWFGEFVSMCADNGFTFQDWESGGPGKDNVADSPRFKTNADGSPRYALKKKVPWHTAR